MVNEHITKEMLKAFHEKRLKSKEQQCLLEHISHCTYCASMFASSFTEETLLTAPRTIKEEVFAQVEKLRPSPKRQLFFYSLRVSAAMCGALLILFATTRIPDTIAPNFISNHSISETVDSISDTEDSISDTANLSFTKEPGLLEGLNLSLNKLTYQIDEKMNSFVSSEKNDADENGGN